MVTLSPSTASTRALRMSLTGAGFDDISSKYGARWI